MNKKFLYGFAVLVIAVFAAVNIHLSSNKYGLSDVSLANVEALARNEGSGPCSMCILDWEIICWYTDYDGCFGIRLQQA